MSMFLAQIIFPFFMLASGSSLPIFRARVPSSYPIAMMFPSTDGAIDHPRSMSKVERSTYDKRKNVFTVF